MEQAEDREGEGRLKGGEIAANLKRTRILRRIRGIGNFQKFQDLSKLFFEN